MLYAAKCYWPGVSQAGLARAGERARREGADRVSYVGSLRFPNGELGQEGQPNWSPDGSKIAFVANGSGSAQLYVMNADGSNPQQLFADPGNDDINPAYSPGGDKIAFSSCQFNQCSIEVISSSG